MTYAKVGTDKSEISTPALLIDLDLLEKNIKTMADYYRGRKGATLLPHQKGHRLPIIAKKQIDAGAVGVSMTSLGLAEYYVMSGIDDILITAPICGDDKIARLCSISRHANVTASVDSIKNARRISEMALASNTRINVVTELYAGALSSSGVSEGISGSGVEMARTKEFVKELEKLRGINFVGLWWHNGALNGIKNWQERKSVHDKQLDEIAVLKDEIEDAGTDVRMLSGGYTCTWNITPEYDRLRNVQVQAGSYVFSDWCSHELEGLQFFDYALTVLTRCISRPRPNEAVFDFGMNSCSDEHMDDYHRVIGPKFKSQKGLENIYEREEISLANVESAGRTVDVGDVFELIPPHSDTTAKLYDKYYGIRNDKVEVVWNNYGRGLL
jgi:D-serine deaminase-like pyridoxal phosphate-dependent protein